MVLTLDEALEIHMCKLEIILDFTLLCNPITSLLHVTFALLLEQNMHVQNMCL